MKFRVCEGWGRLPEGWRYVDVAGVATDSRNRVYVFNRGEHPIILFDEAGSLLGTWGEGCFRRPHGITIGPDDAIWCADDADHTLRKYTPDGNLLLTLGVSGRPSDTGARGTDYRLIQRAGPPFHLPTNLAVAPNGDLYVSDGYGNARVHRFSPEGRLLHSWGEPGAGPGQFHLPHGIAVDREGIVYVADRENSRVQRFAPDGEFLEAWTDLARPTEVFVDAGGRVFVSELGWQAGLYSGVTPPAPDSPGGRISVFTPGGELLHRWGGGADPTAPGDFFAPHDVWVDRTGAVYVGEVIWSAGASRGLVSPDCHALQKFNA